MLAGFIFGILAAFLILSFLESDADREGRRLKRRLRQPVKALQYEKVARRYGKNPGEPGYR